MSTNNSKVELLNSLIEDYFLLVDQTANSSEKLDQLVNLFSEDGFLTPAGGEAFVGKTAVRSQLTDFHEKVSKISKHFFKIVNNDGDQAKVEWAVAAKLNDGNLFTLMGFNIFKLSDDNRIKSLEIFDNPATTNKH